MNILETVDVTKIYPGAEEVVALDHVSFSLEKGDLAAIIGSSGSGKSTLLHLLGGVDTPTKGEIMVQGVNITKLKDEELTVFRRRNIGFIYQFFNLIPSLSVEKNILLPILLDHRREDPYYFAEILETLGIQDKLSRVPSQLSGGEQQRVAIARSLVTRPAIILADEPTGNLDRRRSDELIDLFQLINRKFNATILLITHDEKVALSCHRIFQMTDGHLKEIGDPS